MLNKDGHTTPDNFYLSADKYINDKTTPSGAKPQKADLVKRYKAFFLKLKTVRVIPGKTIEDATEFLDLYDEAPLTEKPDIPMRSMNFREDFDYLNSLNIKGVNLNRAFWLLLDNELDNRRIGPYTKAVTKSSNLDEFLQTVTSELSLKSNVFIDKLKYEVYKLQYLCSKLPQELEDERKRLETEESRDAVMKHVPDNTPLNMSNEEYGILYDKGAKPISDYINKIDGNKLEMLGSRSNQVKKLKEGAETKKIPLVNAADIRSEGESDEPELYKLIDIDISMDVSEQVYKNKMYISTFNPRFGFQEKLMRLFLQLEKPQEPEEDVIMSSGQDSIIDFTDTDEKNLLGDLEDLSRQLTQLNSQKGGGKPPVRHFHSVDFVKISLTETSSITFDINKMTKKDIYNFIKKMVDEDRVTYYKIQYSVGNKDVPTEFKQFPKDDHDAIMQSIARKEAILKSNMAQLNAGLEQKRKAIEDKIKAMREAENKKIAEGAELDKQREEAITKIKLRLDEERDEMNIELEKKLAEAQAELDAAKDREEAKKAELEAAMADAAAAKKKSQEEIEAEVAANKEKIEQKEALRKSNSQKLAILKSQTTKIKAVISAEIIAPMELEISEAKARKVKLELLYKDAPNQARLDAVNAAIDKMEKIKAFVEAAVEASVGEEDAGTSAAAKKLRPDAAWNEPEWTLSLPLKRTYEEALAKYNEPIPWKTFDPTTQDFDKADTTPYKLKAASNKLKVRYDEIKAAKPKYLAKLRDDTIKGVTEYTADEKSKMSPLTATKSSKKVKIECKSPGFEENKEGWCYKKAEGVKEEEPAASKAEPVEEPPRRSGRASKPKKQFGE